MNLFSLSVRNLCLAVLILASTSQWVTTGLATGFDNVIQRQTDDRDHDLIAALLQRQRFDEAISICTLAMKRTEPRSDAAAKWAIRWSQVLSRRTESGKAFDADAILLAQQPVAELLQAYSDHRRALFLQSQLADVEQAAARHVVVIASVSPTNAQQTEAVSAQLARTNRRFVELAANVDTARSDLATGLVSVDQKSMLADLQRLQNELQVQIVSMALLQTDLFPDESRDQLDAASKAQRAAESALAQLPPGSLARLEIQRLRTQAILRGGDLPMALQSLNELARQSPQPLPDRIVALRINLDLKQGKLLQAAKRLKLWYGEQPAAAPRSIEMDLSRLSYLIAAKDDSVGTWLESIETRHGAYARRRAESISLGKLRGSSNVDSIDPAIIAAQGTDWLRRGDPARAATLLAAAARSERSGDLAIKRSLESAAAYIKAKQPTDAAAILSDIAIANRSNNQAANTHLQAAMILSGTNHDDAAKRIEAILLQTQTTWPESVAALQARRWLFTLLDRQNRKQDAAQMATSFLNSNSTAEEVDAALSAWIHFIVASKDADANDRIRQFQSTLTPLRSLPIVKQRYAVGAVYLLDNESLADLPDVPKSSAADSFAAALLQFRRDEVVSETLRSPPDTRVDAAGWRLMRDGKQYPKRRRAIADLMSKWGGDWTQRIPLLVWAGQNAEASALAKQTAATATDPARVWKLLANSLTDTGKRADQELAIEVWDRLASGLPKPSQQWHQAKIAAIELLGKLGNRDEASRRAKYILLTDPPGDADLRRRYELAGKP